MALPSKNKQAFLYVMRAKIAKVRYLYKLGISINPDSRLEDIRVHSPISVEVIHSLGCTNAYQVEHAIHRFFADRRVHGEWFRLSKREVAAIKALRSQSDMLHSEEEVIAALRTIQSQLPDRTIDNAIRPDKHQAFKSRLAMYRRAAGLTVQQLAKQIGVQPSRIVTWENGGCEPRLVHIVALSESLRVTPNDFLLPESKTPSVETSNPPMAKPITEPKPHSEPWTVELRHTWTKEELSELFSKHGSWEAVADAVGRSSSTLLKARQRLGMEKKECKSWNHITADDLLRLYGELKSWAAVASHLNMPSNTMGKLTRRLGIKTKKWNHITTDELLRLYDEHKSWVAVANHFGMPVGVLAYVRRTLGLKFRACRSKQTPELIAVNGEAAPSSELPVEST